MKAVCPKHHAAYEVEAGCLDCQASEPVAIKLSSTEEEWNDFELAYVIGLNTTIPTDEIVKAIAEWKKDPKYKDVADLYWKFLDY
jgi:hypothetical protein